MASISVEIHSQEYNTYSRAIRQKPGAPDRKGARGQAVFRCWFFKGTKVSGICIPLLEVKFIDIREDYVLQSICQQCFN